MQSNIYLLPYKEDFLLELQNNNYSNETLYNYKRDLTVFEAFMNIYQVDFTFLNKRWITRYKGFLKNPNYLSLILDWWDKNKDKIDEYEKKNLDEIYASFSLKKTRRDKNQSLSARSINRNLSALRSYLKFLVDFDLVEKLPISSDSIKLIKTERKKSYAPDFQDLVRLMEFPTHFEKNKFVAARNRAILELLFSSGLRISELVSLNKDDLNDEGKIYIKGKGKKQRFIYITPRAMFYIQEYLKLRKDNLRALFIPSRGGRFGSKNERISTNYIQERIAKYRRILGIVVPISPHSFRHGFATYLIENGASPAAVQILLGHESLHTTDKYVHSSDKFAQETHKKFHPLYTSDDTE